MAYCVTPALFVAHARATGAPGRPWHGRKRSNEITTEPDRTTHGTGPDRVRPISEGPPGMTMATPDLRPLAHDGIDAQHQLLIDIVGHVDRVVREAGDRRALSALLSRLYDTARAHFRDEERLMRSAGYPGLAQHRAHHDQLLGRLAGFIAGIEAETLVFDSNAVDVLRDWVIHHIDTDDHAFGQHLTGRTRAPATA